MSVESTDSKPWVLITGASSGIGKVFAKRFAREGWNLVFVARSADLLNELAQALRKEYSVDTFVIPADLTDRSAPHKIYEEVRRRGIQVDGLVNNAGFGGGGKFAESELNLYLRMIDLNVRALVELTHFFLRKMIEQKRGLIINVSSTASYQPLAYSAIYAATKSFVTSFTEALWLETKGTGVRVLNLCPGLTKTNFGVAAGVRDFRKDPFAQKPEEVVESAFHALQENAPTVISGFRNQLLIFLERFLPHRLLLWIVFLFQKSRGRV